MPEVAAGTPNTGGAPLAVLGGHPDDEPADRVHDPWAARSATAAAVVLPRDQLSLPAAEGLGRDQGVPVTAYPSPEARGLCGQAPMLGVGEPETARTERLSADAMLFLARVNDVTRLLVDPARDGHDEERQHVRKATDGASRAEALGGHERRDPASVQRRISPWDGVDRILGQYAVKRILHDHGIAPAPERNQRTPWKTFLQTHGEGLAAADLFTVEVLTLAGLRRYFVFFVIALKTRRVHIAGIHPQPDGRWMEQMARNLTDPVDGFLRTVRQLMQDCDPLYTRVCGEILTSGDGGPIRLPPKSPNLNASAERFVRPIKEECLHRVVPRGEGHVRLIVHEYVEHDQRERNHQGLDNQLLQRPPPPVRADADVQRRTRLGGLLSFYYREAA